MPRPSSPFGPPLDDGVLGFLVPHRLYVQGVQLHRLVEFDCSFRLGGDAPWAAALLGDGGGLGNLEIVPQQREETGLSDIESFLDFHAAHEIPLISLKQKRDLLVRKPSMKMLHGSLPER